MRLVRVLVCALLVSNFPSLLSAQQAAPVTTPQAFAILQRALSALNAQQPLTDITLTASARRIAGSDDESGTATIKALASGASRLDLSFASGNRTEIFNASTTPPTGSWSGPDGVVHPMAYHNLLTGPFSFFPAFALAASYSSHATVVTDMGLETRNGQSVQHVSLSQPSIFPVATGVLSSASLTRIDLFLDSTTLLPLAITFNTHPDNNALLDIPVEIDFSDYTVVNGAQVPFHIQKLINNSLVLDLQLQKASLNTGITAAQIIGQ